MNRMVAPGPTIPEGLLQGLAKSPGRDFSAALRGEKRAWDNVMFFEMENARAIRTG